MMTFEKPYTHTHTHTQYKIQNKFTETDVDRVAEEVLS
jgi:hypothetical protein